LSAPADLLGFLAHQKTMAERGHSTEWLTRTQSISEQIGQLTSPAEELLTDVTFALSKGLKASRGALANSFAHQECYDELVALAKSCALLNAQLLPIIHQAVLAKFVSPETKIAAVADFRANPARFIAQPDAWAACFRALAAELAQFAKGVGLQPDPPGRPLLLRQLHSELCRELTFEKFAASPAAEARADEAIAAKYAGLAAAIAAGRAGTVAQLLKDPANLAPVVGILETGLPIGSPLEKLEQIAVCFGMLKDLYRFEEGDAATDDEIVVLFAGALAKVKRPGIVSLTKYLQVFLMLDDPAVGLLRAKERKRAALFIRAVEEIKARVH
jgi:hypothetical protein